jgi:hypothetical protein
MDCAESNAFDSPEDDSQRAHWARHAKVQIKWNIATFRNSVHIGSILKRRGLKVLAAEIKMQAS